MRVAVKKIEGVAEATVSLKDGMATIQFAATNRVKVARIWKAVRDNGFTPRQAAIEVDGTVAMRGDSLTLVVGGSGDVFHLQAAPGAEAALGAVRARGAGARLRVAGDIAQTSAKTPVTTPILRVRSATLP